MRQFLRSEGGPSGLLFFCIIFWRFPHWGTGGGFSLCTISSTFFRTYVLFVALPDMTKPPVDLSEVPGVPCYHLIGMIIVPQPGRECKLTGERCGQVGGRLLRPSCP